MDANQLLATDPCCSFTHRGDVTRSISLSKSPTSFTIQERVSVVGAETNQAFKRHSQHTVISHLRLSSLSSRPLPTDQTQKNTEIAWQFGLFVSPGVQNIWSYCVSDNIEHEHYPTWLSTQRNFLPLPKRPIEHSCNSSTEFFCQPCSGPSAFFWGHIWLTNSQQPGSRQQLLSSPLQRN